MKKTIFDGYSVSEDGRVFSHKTNKFLKLFEQNKFGYYGANLYIGSNYKKKFKQVLIHVLMLETYVGPRPHGHQACHLDGNPKNNHISNLKWGTVKENMMHKIDHGTMACGEKNGNSKLTDEQVLSMRNEFKIINNNKTNISELANKYGINEEICRKIIRGKSWCHLPNHRHEVLKRKLTNDEKKFISENFVGGKNSNAKFLSNKFGVTEKTIHAVRKLHGSCFRKVL